MIQRATHIAFFTSLGLVNYLSSCLLTYLLVSGTTMFLVVYLFDLFFNC